MKPLQPYIHKIFVSVVVVTIFLVLFLFPVPERRYSTIRAIAGGIDTFFGKGASHPFLPEALKFEVDWNFEGGFFFLDEKETRSQVGMDLVIHPGEESIRIKKIGKEILSRAANLLEMKDYTSKLIPTYDFPYVLYLDEKEIPRGIYFETGGITPDIRGFGGPLHLGILLDENGIILKTVYVRSNETPAYIRMLEKAEYFKKLSQFNINGGEYRVNAVTGATISSQATVKTVTESVDRISDSILETYMPVDSVHKFRVYAGRSPWWVAYLFLVLLFYPLSYLKIFHDPKFRLPVYILSILLVGFLINGSVTYTTFMNPFFGTSLSPVGGLLLLVSILIAIWDKNIYCNHVCPFGAAQRLTAWATPFKKRRFFLSQKSLYFSRGVILIFLTSGIYLGYQEWTAFEPFPYFFSLNASDYWFWFSVGFVLLSARYPFLWCRGACPTGAFLDLFVVNNNRFHFAGKLKNLFAKSIKISDDYTLK